MQYTSQHLSPLNTHGNCPEFNDLNICVLCYLCFTSLFQFSSLRRKILSTLPGVLTSIQSVVIIWMLKIVSMWCSAGVTNGGVGVIDSTCIQRTTFYSISFSTTLITADKNRQTSQDKLSSWWSEFNWWKLENISLN